MYARTVFYKINTTEPLNPEAAVLWVPDTPPITWKGLPVSHLVDVFVQSIDDVGQEQAWAGTYCMLYVLAPKNTT